jgi:hypothetical protein
MRIAGMICGLLVLFSSTAFSQEIGSGMAPYESDILAARPIRTWLGIGLGAYGFWHHGSFSPNCRCAFGGEDGGNVFAAAEVMVQYPKLGFALKIMASYYDASAEFSYNETRRSVQVGGLPDIDVEYHKDASVHYRWLSFMPAFAWYVPKSSLFLQAGLDVGFPLQARYNNIESIVTPDVTYYEGGRQVTLLEESDIPGGNDIRVALAGAIGYDIQLSSSFMFTPQIGGALPLTAVSSDDSSWKISTAYGVLFLKFRL